MSALTCSKLCHVTVLDKINVSYRLGMGKKMGLLIKIWKDTIDLLVKGTVHTRMKVIGGKTMVKPSATSDIGHLTKSLKKNSFQQSSLYMLHSCSVGRGP